MNSHFSVAAPWGLSHYIQLKGFNPLYRALFDHAPAQVAIKSWDNIKLHNQLSSNSGLRNTLVRAAETQHNINSRTQKNIEKTYLDFFWSTNQVLTKMLIGDIEFHHTAPFPSLNRPFIFHCESFSSIFHPFSLDGNCDADTYTKLRSHYQSIFSNPLCLGIFSHIPETLNNIKLFFNDEQINSKLFNSKIGLSAKSLMNISSENKWPLTKPKFLFINSANQSPDNFFTLGGHLVLRFWKNFLTEGRQGLLMLGCAKPSELLLREHGVDCSFINTEIGRSIVWINDYLTNDEQNALMQNAHFFLLPSMCLHSVSIMQAMALGAIPVVTDTIGTSCYVNDNHGIILTGVRSNLWQKNTDLGIELNSCQMTTKLENSLVAQMSKRITNLLDDRSAFQSLLNATTEQAKIAFSGESYSLDFWNKVSELLNNYYQHLMHNKTIPKHVKILKPINCIMHKDDISRVFESPTQPLRKIYTGSSVIYELGGSLIHAYGNPKIELNDWSVLAQHLGNEHPKISFAKTMPEFQGNYITSKENPKKYRWLSPQFISNILMPYPMLHKIAKAQKQLFRPIFKYLINSFNNHKKELDIRLIIENHFGYKIIFCLGKYYAIPISEGEFIIEKARKNKYTSMFYSHSIDNLLKKITLANNGILQ